MEVSNNVNMILLNQLGSTNSSSNVPQHTISTILQNKYSTNPIASYSISDVAELSTTAIDNYYTMREENAIWGLDLIRTTSDALDELRNNLAFFYVEFLGIQKIMEMNPDSLLG